jgi:UDP-N-acetylglucosamine 4,6-dehydratase
MIENKTILIFGGSGSLGHELISRYVDSNKLYVYSRDEAKHWKMKVSIQHDNLDFVIGDVINKEKVIQTLCRVKPHIVLMCSAMKHIDICEKDISASLNTNIIGNKNILDSIEENRGVLFNLEKVCFISTDKACSPVNVYGMCKAISEGLIVEKANHIPEIKFVTVRYGNVLNSRGSIIPLLHELCKSGKQLRLTDKRMTRFVMTLEQSVNLIEYALLKGESGDIVIPKLISMNLIDLFEIFAEKYNKTIEISSLRPGEKLLESLINTTQSMRIQKGEDDYLHIKSPLKYGILNTDPKDYNSKLNPLSKEELKEHMVSLGLL